MSNSNHPGRPVDPNSRLSRAHAVYARLVDANPAVTSADICATFVSELGVSKGTAQVYLFKAREALGLTSKRPRAEAAPAEAAPAEAAPAEAVAEAAPAEAVAEDKVAEAA